MRRLLDWLDAIHRAVRLTYANKSIAPYISALKEVVYRHYAFDLRDLSQGWTELATAPQCCEALLRAKGLWEESA